MKRKMLTRGMLMLLMGAGSGAYFSGTNLQLLALQQGIQESVSHVSVVSPSLRSQGSSNIDLIVAYLAAILCGVALLSVIVESKTYRFLKYAYTSVELTPQKEKHIRR
jgi:hypothetical protein